MFTACYERLQDKLNQARDARAALDALREEHRDKLRLEAEEAERQRQIQMAYKLEIMRKKKQVMRFFTQQDQTVKIVNLIFFLIVNVQIVIL